MSKKRQSIEGRSVKIKIAGEVRSTESPPLNPGFLLIDIDGILINKITQLPELANEENSLSGLARGWMRVFSTLGQKKRIEISFGDYRPKLKIRQRGDKLNLQFGQSPKKVWHEHYTLDGQDVIWIINKRQFLEAVAVAAEEVLQMMITTYGVTPPTGLTKENLKAWEQEIASFRKSFG